MKAPLLSRSHRRRSRVQFPIEVFFDGDGGQYFTGGWSEVGGNVLNDQIVTGSELLANSNFANWTGDDPDGWTVDGEVGADPEVSEVGSGQGHGGGGNGLCNLFSSATDSNPVIRQTKMTIGQWFRAAYVLDTGTSGAVVSEDNNGEMPLQKSTSGSYFNTGRATATRWKIRGVTAPIDVTIDDASLKLLTLSSLLNPLKNQLGLSDGFFIDVAINAVTADTQVGIIWNLDDPTTPANFGMAYMNGTNLIVDKNVAGTYSNLASVAQAVTQDQILRIENPAGSNVLNILYNGVSKATPTIADASIIGNSGIALFSTEANNAISKVVIGRL